MHSFNASSVTAANPRDDASTSYHHCYWKLWLQCPVASVKYRHRRKSLCLSAVSWLRLRHCWSSVKPAASETASPSGLCWAELYDATARQFDAFITSAAWKTTLIGMTIGVTFWKYVKYEYHNKYIKHKIMWYRYAEYILHPAFVIFTFSHFINARISLFL